MKRLIGTREVNAIGLGCMGLSHGYGVAPTPAEAERVLLAALDLGYNHLDTARLYGGGRNEALVGTALKARRGEFFLASKAGIVIEGASRRIDCSRDALHAAVDVSLKTLQTDHIDLYYMHRRDFTVPIEDSVGALAELVTAGKIGGIGLSEMSAETLRRAHATHPIAAMQTEYSPWTRNVEIAVRDTARELEVALVAFSPLGRGVLADGLRDPATLLPDDIRYTHPRFNADNWPRNLALIDAFNALAREAGVTPAQLSLAWVLSRGEHVHAIPGTTSLTHLAENVARADWRPDQDLLERAGALINQQTVAGSRYPAGMQKTIETEEFAD